MSEPYPSIEELYQPFLKMAGLTLEAAKELDLGQRERLIGKALGKRLKDTVPWYSLDHI